MASLWDLSIVVAAVAWLKECEAGEMATVLSGAADDSNVGCVGSKCTGMEVKGGVVTILGISETQQLQDC